MKLQEVAKNLRPAANAAIHVDQAVDSIGIALGALIVEILQRYFYEVRLGFDPKRPQEWENYLAVAELEQEGRIVRIPVPKLRALDSELAEEVRRYMMKDVRSKQCICGHFLHEHAVTQNEVVWVDPAYESNTSPTPKPGYERRVRAIHRECTQCDCRNFVLFCT